MSETLLDLFEQRVNQSGSRAALRRKVGGCWERQSWKEWWEHSERIAAGLMELGVGVGDRVALLCTTRMEWAWVDMAVAMLGGVLVPLSAGSTPQHCALVLAECDVRVVVAEDPSQVDKVLEARTLLAEGKRGDLHLVYIENHAVMDVADWKGRTRVRLEDVAGGVGELRSLEHIAELGRRALSEDHQRVLVRRRAVKSEDLASIVYTSGVRGEVRGVMLSHGNFARQVRALGELGLFSQDDVHLLWLPLSHVFGRMILMASVGFGVETVFGQGLSRLVENMREVEPTFMAGVPRVYERIMEGFLAQAEKRPVRGKLFHLALDLGRGISRSLQRGEPVGRLVGWEHGLASGLLFKELHGIFGNRLRFLISGGVPLRPEVSEFFHAAGLLILEGYGQTETTGALSFNMPDGYRFGTVGRPLPGVDVTISEAGEVWVRSETVMQGYVGADGACVGGLNEEGWLNTGDRGHFDADGFLVIETRKKAHVGREARV